MIQNFDAKSNHRSNRQSLDFRSNKIKRTVGIQKPEVWKPDLTKGRRDHSNYSNHEINQEKSLIFIVTRIQILQWTSKNGTFGLTNRTKNSSVWDRSVHPKRLITKQNRFGTGYKPVLFRFQTFSLDNLTNSTTEP